MENVATLVDPPGSRLAEEDWTASVLAASGCDLLLDLHNLHANAVNFGFDPLRFLDRVPAEAIAGVHVAGGAWVGPPDGRRILDDHRHDVPAPVYDLLEETARRVTRPLTVVLERDGAYPPITDLLAQLDAARAALVRGRARRVARAA